MKKSIRYILLLIVVASVLMIGTGCDLFIKTNNGRVDLNWYMKLTYEDANGNDQPYNSNMGQVAAVALESGYADEYGLVVKDEAYLNIDTVKSNIDDRFYWDKKEKLLLFTNANEIYKINIGEKKITSVYAGTTEDIDYNAAIVENEKCFVNMKFVTKFIDMDYSTDEQNGDVPAKVMLSYTIGEKDIMSTTKKIEMRTKGNYQNLIVAVVDKGTKVEVVETGRDWNKVRTNDGFIGYVPVKRLKEEKAKKQEYKSDLEEYTHTTLNKKVSLAWNQIYNQTANNNIDMLMENVKGVNVLSPTWFSICDKLGNLSTLADYTYVEKAHSKGIQVWALVNDFSDKKLTKTVLTSTTIRQRLVSNIMYFVNSYELDGINIDFEFITKDIVGSYLQFLRELSIECRKSDKVLSVDNYAPSEWSLYYDREQQALLADYIIIMNYDEHTVGSTEAGSVSSMGYAEKSIKDTIKEVKDASRVINGMPFYTRVWKETPEADSDKTGVYIEDAVNGNYYLTSEAVGMDTAKKAYKEAGVKPTLDDITGQNFVSYSKGSSTYMIWLEDSVSVKSRLELMNNYELGGAAYWALGQETDSIWKTIALILSSRQVSLMKEKYMREAIKQAKKASSIGEVPIGCVIVYNDEIVGRGYNRRMIDKNTLSHAELNAIKKASKKLQDWRLDDCEMYVTTEPCQMCAGAIVQARIKKVYIGCMNPKAGCAGSIMNLLQIDKFNHQVEIETGIMENECSSLLKEFFKKLRES